MTGLERIGPEVDPKRRGLGYATGPLKKDQAGEVDPKRRSLGHATDP